MNNIKYTQKLGLKSVRLMKTFLTRNKATKYLTLFIFPAFFLLAVGELKNRLFLNDSIKQLSLISAESSVFIAVKSCASLNCAIPLDKASISKLSAAIMLASNGERFYPLRGGCELIVQAEDGVYHYFFGYLGRLIVIHPFKRLSELTLVKYVSASNYKSRQLLIQPDFVPKGVDLSSCVKR